MNASECSDAFQNLAKAVRDLIDLCWDPRSDEAERNIAAKHATKEIDKFEIKLEVELAHEAVGVEARQVMPRSSGSHDRTIQSR